MMNKVFLLDSNILIYATGGDRELSELIISEYCSVSILSKLEILGFHGISDSESKQIQEFLNELPEMQIHDLIIQIAIDLRKRYKLKTIDSIILATASYYDMILVTADKQLSKVQEVRVMIHTPQIT